VLPWARTGEEAVDLLLGADLVVVAAADTAVIPSNAAAAVVEYEDR
jgi:hypothetical protein